MSLYSDGEICTGCIHAEMYPCGNCRKSCAIDAEPNHLNGTCDGLKETCDAASPPTQDKEKT